jgi:hypothetical protein
MTSRIAPLTFLSLLLAGSLVYAAPAAPNGTPTVPATIAQASTLAEAPSCGQAGTTAAIFAPAPQNKATDFDYCGTCGQDPCRGVLRGTVCGYDFNLGRYKRCEMTLGDLCPNENRVVCYCYAEDIP